MSKGEEDDRGRQAAILNEYKRMEVYLRNEDWRKSIQDRYKAAKPEVNQSQCQECNKMVSRWPIRHRMQKHMLNVHKRGSNCTYCKKVRK